MNTLSSAKWTTVVMITVIAHSFSIEFLVYVWTFVNNVLLVIFTWFLFRFLDALRILKVNGGTICFFMYRRAAPVLFDLLGHLLAVGLCLLGSIGARLRVEVNKFLSHRGNILKENLQDVFLNLFFSGSKIFGPKSIF